MVRKSLTMYKAPGFISSTTEYKEIREIAKNCNNRNYFFFKKKGLHYRQENPTKKMFCL